MKPLSKHYPAVLAAVCALGITACAAQAQKPEGRKPNRLARETSPYLLQHQHNPIDWYAWEPEAFEKARKEDKPIFLSVGYSACHWCHVMERESFEDEGVAKLLNDHFVSIKVDREERPDIDEIYMAALLAMHGRGGWPMSLFLTADGKPFSGGTYFARDDFAERLRRIQELWVQPEQRKRITEAGEAAAKAIGQGSFRLPGGDLSPALLNAAVRGFLSRLDEKHGGFGGAPKFPPSVRLALLLAEHRRKPDPKVLAAVTLTLNRMARGGMYDQVGGGFHRYSVDEKWLVPHFEKMLYDNALLADLYLETHRITGDPYFKRIGTETLDFVLRELRDPSLQGDSGGAFWSALDADSESPEGKKEEGRFYTWTPSEIAAVLGTADAAVFNRVYDITDAGNFEGRSIPNLLARPVETAAKELKTTPDLLWKRLDGMRAKLLVARSKRARPFLDDKVLANWNGLMVRALATGYDVTGEKRYREAAEAAASFVLGKMRGPLPGGGSGLGEAVRPLLHSYRAGRTQPVVFLEDYSFLIDGLLRLHEATADVRWREHARALAGQMIADFWDEKGKTFFSTPHHHEALLARLSAPEDNATPSGQAVAAAVLVRLGRLTNDAELTARSRLLLDSHAGSMKLSPDSLPGLLLAASTYLTPLDAPAAPAAGVQAEPAQAEPTAPGGDPEKEKEPVSLSLSSPPKGLKEGQTFEIKVRFEIKPGWHVNGEKPGDQFLLPTTVALAPGPFKQVAVVFPPAKQIKVSFAEKPVNMYLESMSVTIKAKALAGADKAGAIRANVRYQACNDSVCLRPVKATLSAPLSR